MNSAHVKIVKAVSPQRLRIYWLLCRRSWVLQAVRIVPECLSHTGDVDGLGVPQFTRLAASTVSTWCPNRVRFLEPGPKPTIKTCSLVLVSAKEAEASTVWMRGPHGRCRILFLLTYRLSSELNCTHSGLVFPLHTFRAVLSTPINIILPLKVHPYSGDSNSWHSGWMPTMTTTSHNGIFTKIFLQYLLKSFFIYCINEVIIRHI